MLEINIETRNDIPVLNLKGRLDGLGATIFLQETQQLSAKFWITDFSQLNYLSSAGIRALVQSQKKLHQQAGNLFLVALNQDLTKIIKLTGLQNIFHIFPNSSAAMKYIQKLDNANRQKLSFQQKNRNYSAILFPKNKNKLIHWPQLPELYSTNLAELNYAFGIGGLGTSAAQAQGHLGCFISTPKFMGVLPADGYNMADFDFYSSPGIDMAQIQKAISITGEPEAYLEYNAPATTLQQFLTDATELNQEQDLAIFYGFVKLEKICYAYYNNPNDIVCQNLTEKDSDNGKYAFLMGFYDVKQTSVVQLAQPDVSHIHATLLSSLQFEKINFDFSEITNYFENINQLENVTKLQPQSVLSAAKLWFLFPQQINSIQENRLEIVYDTELKPEWQTIIRKIYTDSAKVELNQLQGGFTSKTYQVTSYNLQGRKQLPTVLKIGSQQNTKNEVNAYQKYVQKFILNNSTAIMGTAYVGKWGGLRYNFLGITGKNSKLRWLTADYQQKTAEQLYPIFDRVFTDILKPWYGQPKWVQIKPYELHDPRNLFSGLLQSATEFLPETMNQPQLEIFGRTVVNPYYFLQHQFPKLKNRSYQWYQGINHRDLNMQNILLDEKDNIYVIDFSETGITNITADFGRLEPIFKFEMINLDRSEKLQQLLDLEETLIATNSISQLPPLPANVTEPKIIKTYKMIKKVREYADRVTLFENDIVPYLLAILEWTLPVVCYVNADQKQKQAAIYSAGLICQKLAELEEI